jgi:hypothetical protein
MAIAFSKLIGSTIAAFASVAVAGYAGFALWSEPASSDNLPALRADEDPLRNGYPFVSRPAAVVEQPRKSEMVETIQMLDWHYTGKPTPSPFTPDGVKQILVR